MSVLSGASHAMLSRMRVGDPNARKVDIPVNKTKADCTKPVDPQVGKAIEAWEAIRPAQPQRIDRKTGESVDFLFMHRARPMRREFINESLMPILCQNAGVARDDVRGPITSHRARATIASQLFNAREPMTLFEVQAWLGHGSPASTPSSAAAAGLLVARGVTNSVHGAKKEG